MVRNCPLCGIAMIGSKSRDDSQQVDTFSCLKCETVISFVPPASSLPGRK
jgi:hypothetical protein